MEQEQKERPESLEGNAGMDPEGRAVVKVAKGVGQGREEGAPVIIDRLTIAPISSPLGSEVLQRGRGTLVYTRES